MLATLATARADQDGATPAVEAKPAGAIASVPVPAAGATVAPPQKGEQSPPTPALTAAEPITPTDVAVKEEEVLIFSCRCCGNQYASTDGVRKHARKAHAKWLKAKDQDTTDRIASGERLCRSDAYCAQRRVPRSEAEALMAERERPVGRPAKAARRASREAAAHEPELDLGGDGEVCECPPARDERSPPPIVDLELAVVDANVAAAAAAAGSPLPAAAAAAFGGGGGGFGSFTDRVVFGGQPPLKRGASLMSVFGDTAQFDAEDYALDRAASSVARGLAYEGESPAAAAEEEDEEEEVVGAEEPWVGARTPSNASSAAVETASQADFLDGLFA